MERSFQTTSGVGIDYNSFPMRLWEKAKKYGIWNPADIDFSQDAKDWARLTDLEKEFIMRTLVQFQAGEEAVTLDLLPLIMAVAKEGRLEEEMFLTTFLWEEAKHVDGFHRFLNTVLTKEELSQDMSSMMVPSYKAIFYQFLPEALNKLIEDPSPVNQARASVTYNMIVEGVLAETGYFSFYETLSKNNIMPGLLEFVGKLKQDESRHIAYGIYLISRLVAENGDEVWEAVEQQMNALMIPAMGVVTEGFALYDEYPFGIEMEPFTNFAMGQFQKRWARIQKARAQSLEEINSLALVEE